MGTFDQIKKDIMDAMKAGRESGTRAYDTEAEVIRTSGSTAWVHIPGGVDETPVKMTIHADPGDKVQVRVSGGSAWLVGNETAPPTDDTTAIEAKLKSLEADLNAKKAMQSAEDAALLAQTNAAKMAEAVIAINSDIENLQDQIDGNITTWYYAYAPTLSNEPASTWTTTEEKNNHIGDIFYNSETGYSYRFMLNGSNYEWVRISDEDISAALEAASAAQDTADHKRRVFIARPTVPYDEGDLWCVGSSGDILTCTNAKTSSQSYAASDWSKLNKYTDDTVANAAAQAAASAQQSADSAAEAAQTAWNHADEANTAAIAAGNAAESAQSSADSALQSASTANVAANSALTQLSVVEDVVDVLNWISEHGTYKATADTKVVAGKYYFTRSGTSPNYTYTVVTNPTGNPKTKGYYELDSVDEAVSNYVSSHLALTNQGLWVVNDNSSYKILLASDGMKVYDASGNLVSTFGESITFSSTRPQTIGNSSSYVKFYKDGSTWKIAISADAINLGSNAVATQSYADGKASTAESNAKNYSDNAVNAAKAEIKVTTDGIASTVEKIGGFKYLVSATSGTTWTGFLGYAQEGKETLFTIESGALGCRIGDNVYLKYKDTTNNVFRYIRGTVIEQPTADNKIKLVAHGYEDIRPVDTIKSTINQSADSVKIQAKHVDIEGAAIFSSGRLSETSLDAAYDAKGAAGVVQENLDNLEIGGRNLLIDTNAPSLTKIAAISDRYWSNATSLAEDGTAEIVEINDSPVKGIKYGARFSATTQRTTKRTHELAFRNNTFEAGQTYTMSFWAKLVSGGVNDVRFNFQNRTTAGIVDDCRYEPTSDWKKYSWTFTPTTKVENVVVYMGMAYLNIGIIEMCGFKVEKGNRATDWTPAPEDVENGIATAQLTADGANAKEQLIYISKATGTTSVSANTTWVTNATGNQNVWTTKRPEYSQSYPVLFVATQRQTVAQSSGTTCSCTTPMIDDTITVIDGGNIITGTVTTNQLNSGAVTIGKLGSDVKQNISDAAKTASNYIVADSTGLMVAELNGSGETPSTATTNNVLIDSDSVDVRDGQTVLATFGTETAMYTKDGTELAHFGYANGNAASGMAVKPYYTLGKRAKATDVYSPSNTYNRGDMVIYDGTPYICIKAITTAEAWDATKWINAALGNWSVAEGDRIVSSGYDSHAEGYRTIASAMSAHAEGGTTLASGAGSHAEGQDTTASGELAHAEGYLTVSSGIASHAEGYKTTANGYASHAEGVNTTASGYSAHAEGFNTVASGQASHAGGHCTHATKQYQTVIGYFNELTNDDAGNYIFVIGNGNSEAERSNAFTVGWGGGVVAKGNGTFLSQKMVYEAGDVVAATNGIFAGYLTNSSKKIQFFVPLPKPRTPGIKCAISGDWTIRHVGGGYILNGATLQSIGTVSASVYETGVFITVALTSAVSVTNNTPVSVNGTSNAKITFSA